MKKPVQALIFGVFFLIFVSMAIWITIWIKSNPSEPKKSLPVLTTLSEFSLIDNHNNHFTLETLKGKIWIADFIFTRCQGPCPIMSSHMQRLQRILSNSADVLLASFSVDPEYDTPEILTKYADSFGAQEDKWLFITGDREIIYNLARSSLKLSVEKKTKLSPIIHSTNFVLIDETGTVRGYYDANENDFINKLILDVQILLGERQLKLAR